MDYPLAGGDAGEITVLCVDDDEGMLDVTSMMLERADDRFTVETATRPSVGLDVLEDSQIDCVVSDYEMPKTDGLEFLEAVRDRGISVPFILFTGRGSEEIASEAISRGVTEYLQKGGSSDRYRVLANRIEQAVERDRAERELAWERDRRDALFVNNPDPVVEGLWMDAPAEEGPKVVDVNPAFERVFGYDAETVRGEKIDEFILPADSDAETEARRLNAAAVGNEPIHREVRRKTADGLRDFLLTLVPLEIEGKHHAGYGIYTDITEQKRRERRIEALQERSQSLIRAESEADVAREAAAIAHDVLDVPYATVCLRSETESGAEVLEPIVPAGANEQPSEHHAYHRDEETAPSAAVWAVLESGEPRSVETVAGLDCGADVELSTGTIHPLGDHGVFVAAASSADAFDGTVRALAEIVTANLTAALDRIEREQTLATLHSVATEIQACETVQEVCERTIAAAEELLDFEICVIDIYDDGMLVPVALSSEWDPADANRVDADHGLTGTTFQTGETYIVDDVPSHPKTDPERESFRSVVSVPVGDVGVFQAVDDEYDAFDESDAELAELLLAHAAGAMDGMSFDGESGIRPRG
jgi:PAS domain S-box-containing protein